MSAVFRDENKDALPDAKVEGGTKETAGLSYAGEFRYLDTEGNDLGSIEKTLSLPEEVRAPIQAGQKAGEALYSLNGKTIGTVDVLYTESVEAAVYRDYLLKVLLHFLL